MKFHRVLAFALAIATVLQGAALAADDTEYKLGSGDKIQITVFGQPTLSGDYEIDGSGTVSLPLIGELRAGTKTLRQFEKEIVAKLQPDYLKNPRVSVQVTNYRMFYIIGEVNKPGGYPYVNGMTMMNAVALAEGYTYRARSGRLLVTRASEPARDRIPADHASPVLPGDIIEVPERFF